MEQTTTPPTPDPQAGPGDKASTRPQPPADMDTTSADTAVPPADDTGFEPV